MLNLIAIILLSMVSPTQRDTLGPAGGPGGAYFSYQCANNGYLIGLQAHVGAVIDSIQAICAKYDPATRELYAKGPEGPVFGGDGGNLMLDAPTRHVGCKTRDVIYAFDGALSGANAWSFLARIRLACVDARTLQRPTHPALLGDYRRIILQGSDGINESSNRYAICSEGRIARGIWGTAGKYVNSFGLFCVPAGAPEKPKSEEHSYSPGEHTFINPTKYAPDESEYLIDWCQDMGTRCGEPAALDVCHTHGLSFLVDFKTRPNAWKTVLPKTDSICSGPTCTGFAEVTCADHQPKPIDRPGTEVHQTPGSRPSPVGTSPDANMMTGTFQTDFGELQLTPAGGTYSYANGRVTATSVHDAIMEGTWEQSKASQACPDGRFWGHFVFSFTPAGFTGFFGYCDGQLTAGPWNGKRLN